MQLWAPRPFVQNELVDGPYGIHFVVATVLILFFKGGAKRGAKLGGKRNGCNNKCVARVVGLDHFLKFQVFVTDLIGRFSPRDGVEGTTGEHNVDRLTIHVSQIRLTDKSESGNSCSANGEMVNMSTFKGDRLTNSPVAEQHA